MQLLRFRRTNNSIDNVLLRLKYLVLLIIVVVYLFLQGKRVAQLSAEVVILEGERLSSST